MVTQSLEPLRVLLVEDDEDDYMITRDMLARQERARFAVDWRSQYHESLQAIREGNHDVYADPASACTSTTSAPATRR